MPHFKRMVDNAAFILTGSAALKTRIDEYWDAFKIYWKANQFRDRIAELNPHFWSVLTKEAIYDEKGSSWYQGPGTYGATPDQPALANVGYIICSVPTVIPETAAFSAERDHANPKQFVKRPAGNANGTWTFGDIVKPDDQHYPGDPHRSACTENRLLNGLPLVANGPLAGDILLFTERLPCPSCRRVIHQFLDVNRDVSLRVVYNFDEPNRQPPIDELLASGADVSKVAQRDVPRRSPAVDKP